VVSRQGGVDDAFPYIPFALSDSLNRVICEFEVACGPGFTCKTTAVGVGVVRFALSSMR
jgi:hypothetical protein